MRCQPGLFTRQDGTTGASYEVSANTVRFLTPKGEAGAPGGEEAPEAGAGDAEIPF